MYYYNLSLNEDIFNPSKFLEEIFYFDDIDFKYICKDYKRLYCIAIGLNNLYIEKYDDDEGRLWKAYKLHSLGYNKKALSILDNLPESFLDNFYFNYLKSSILLNLSRYDDALFYTNKGLKNDLDNEEYYLQNQNKGKCLYYLGDYNEAINCFNKAIQLVEEISDPFIFLSKISIKNKKYEDALKTINTAIKFEIADLNRIKRNHSTLFFEKTDCEVFYYKSFILFKLKRYDEALKICNCILDKIPDCSEAIKLKNQIEINY